MAVIFAAVDLGMKGLPMVDMLCFTPALRMTSFETPAVAQGARVILAGVVLGIRVQTAALSQLPMTGVKVGILCCRSNAARWRAVASGLGHFETLVVVVEPAETTLLGVVPAAMAAGGGWCSRC